LIGYIHNHKKLYHEIFNNLLNTWSNQASIVNTSYEQHLYLTKCILVCISYMQDEDKNELGSQLMRFLLKGAERHLHSPLENVRTLGMIVSENLMNLLHDQNIKKLEFEVGVI
jgi:telomere length regulation protein